MPAARPLAAALAVLALSGAIGPGCAPYRGGLQPILDHLSRGDAPAALAQLERAPREEDALYQLERGMLLRAAGRFDESNLAFDDADRIAEDLYTRSVTNEAASLVTSDRVRPYRPAPYERLLARVYQARNYADRGDLEGALVEARRIEALLDELRDANGGEVRVWMPAAYITAGLLQEAGGMPDDALRVYRRLYLDAERAGGGTADLSPWLPERMRRLARGGGIDLDDLLGPSIGEARIAGEPAFTAVIYFEQGFVPPREEIRLDVPILKSESGTEPRILGPILGDRVICMRDGRCRYDPVEIDAWLSIAVPVYGREISRPSRVWGKAGGSEAEVALTADVAALAREHLEGEMGSVLARTAVRALLKLTAQHQAKKAGGEFGGIVAGLFSAATEAAETRTWLTPPREISMVAVDLASPTDTVCVGWIDGGMVREKAIPLRRIRGTNFGLAGYRSWR
jgi:hypothetical protein